MTTRIRRLFAAGRLLRCTAGRHAGPFVRADEYDAHPDPMWRGFVDCAACGSTLHAPTEAA